jgi:hypothetical protein
VERLWCVGCSEGQRQALPRSRRATFALLIGLMGLGTGCSPTSKVETPSTSDVPTLSQAMAMARIEVYYADWMAFRLPIEEEALCDASWEYKIISRLAVFHVDRLRSALATTKTHPLNEVPHDFTLACTMDLIGNGEHHETLRLSFAKYPESVRLDGRWFKPSKELILLISEFLPCEAGESWRAFGE